jgi:hypothetical protein
MASSRKLSSRMTGKVTVKTVGSGRLAGRKATTGVVKAEHKRKVVRRKSAEAAGAERNDPNPIKARK